MTNFPLHTPDTAPAAAKPVLRELTKQFGFLPNLFAQLAEAPAALDAYLALAQHFERSSLTATERQVVLLATSVENECAFCVAAHSVIAKAIVGVGAATVQALRERRPLPDARLNALAKFTREVVAQRGWVNEPAVDAFLKAGYTRQQVIEVVLGVTLKTLSNYTNHIARTPLNEQFAGEKWSRELKAA